MSQQKIKILLVDDHVLLRKALSRLLSGFPQFEVVGEAGNGKEAVEKALALKPQVILMDIRMPGMDGIAATRAIKEKMPQVRVLMLTVVHEDESLFEALKAGAHGYLLKDLEPESLTEAILDISRGQAVISPSLATKVLNVFVRQLHAREVSPDGTGELTAREREVLKLLSQGYSNKEIAAALNISLSTVKNHVHSILDKLHLKSRTEAAALFYRLDL